MVVVDNLVVRYGARSAVDGLSFAARPGHVTALLGPNGAGKTSTVETLEGYRTPSAGQVSVLGMDPRRDHRQLVPRIGVMLQQGGVYPGMGPAQALHLFAAYYAHPVDPEALLSEVGLDHVRRTPWRRLSGGEQQRLSLALALIGRPDVLFLDEPTAGVDPEGRLIVRDLIARQRDAGVAILLTTHELAEVEKLADHVLIIDHGRALAEGTVAELAAVADDGSIRFGAHPGLDTSALADHIRLATTGHAAADTPTADVEVTEGPPGTYRVVTTAQMEIPAVVAAITTWLANNGTTLSDLRTGHSLEEAYLAITGRRPEPERTESTGRRDRRGRRAKSRIPRENKEVTH